MTADRQDGATTGSDDQAAGFEAAGFAAMEFETILVGKDGGTDRKQVAGYGCDGLGVHLDGEYWRIVALGSGAPLGLMPTVSATLRLCTRILELEGPQPAELPDAVFYAQVRQLQAEIVAEVAEELRQRAEHLAEEIDYLEEKANDFQARAIFGALPGQGLFSKD